MNKSYKSVWNESTGSWVAVSELATGRSKSKRAKTAISKAILTQIAVGGMSLAGASAAMADAVTPGTVNVTNGVAIGADSQADADLANPAKTGGVAIGDSAYTIGSGVAVGQNSQADSDSLAFGASANAANGGTAIGNNSYAINNGGVAIGQNASANGTGALAIGMNSSVTGAGSVALGKDSVATDINTVSVGNATVQRKIVNLAAGTTATDAVNVGQLTAAGLIVNSSGVAQNAFVAYDSTTSMDTITLKGTSGSTKITKLSAGALNALSSDAVNGSQLFNTASSAAAAIGGTSTFDPTTGKISKPSIVVGNTTYDNLSGAVAAAAVLAGNGSADGVQYNDSTHGKVTLGGTSATAPVTLTNVAAGTTATDAVNFKQLNDLASSMTTIESATKYIRFGTTSAMTAGASGQDALAIGGNAFAVGIGALAIGSNASAMAKNAVAIGTGSDASEANTVSFGALGTERRLVNVDKGTSDTDAVNLGQVTDLIKDAGLVKSAPTLLKSAGTRQLLGATANVTYTPDQLILAGPTELSFTNEALGQNSISMGLNTHANGLNAVAVGSNVQSTGENSVAVGYLTIANGLNAQAFGSGATVKSDDGLALGYNAKVQINSPDAIAIGTNSQVTKDSAVAIGLKAASAGVGTFVLGNNSTATGDGTVVLGNNVKGAAKNSVVLGAGSDATLDNVVSVGAKGTERRIVNVAAGTTATDAVNLGQMTQAIASGASSPDAVIYDTSSHDKLTLGGTGAAVTLSNVAKGVKGTDAVNVDQLTAAGLTVGTDGKPTNSFVAYDANKGTTSVTLGTGTVGAQIHQVVDGTADKDAINLSQLKAAGITVGTDGKPTNSFVAYDANKGTTSVTLGTGTVGAQIHNLVAGTTGMDAINLNQLNALGAKIGSDGKPTNSFVAYDVGGTTSITLGTGTVGTKITQLTAGTVSAASRDAINGAQLFAASAATAAALGGDSKLDGNGNVVAPAIKIGGTTYNTIAGAVTAAADLAATGSTEGVKYDTTAHDLVTFGNTAGKAVTLSNVAQGVKGTDAVNVDQLTAAGLTVGTDGKPTNSFVAYDANKGTTSVTLGTGTVGAQIHQVVAGTADTDAINLKQLNDAMSDTTAVSSSLKYVRFGVSDALTAGASGKDSVAIGGNAFANGVGSVAIGRDAASSALNSVAIGIGASADSRNSVALGQKSIADAENTVSVGSFELQRRVTNVATGTDQTDAVNLGQVEAMMDTKLKATNTPVVRSLLGATSGLLGATASLTPDQLVKSGDGAAAGQIEALGTDSIAMGLNVHAINNDTVAIGNNVNAGGVGSVGIGRMIVSSGVESTAIGVNAQAKGDAALAIGNMTKSFSVDGVSLGNSNLVNTAATTSVAIGKSNTVSGAGSVVIGMGNKTSATDSFVLGSNIIGTDAVNKGGKNNVVLGAGSDGSLDNVVSVGAAGKERKIVNVAAGTATTDAVNYGQLNEAIASVGTGGGSGLVSQDLTSKDILVAGTVDGTRVNFANNGGVARELINVAAGTTNTSAVNLGQLKPAITALGGNASVDAAGNVTGPTYNVQGATQATVGDALTALDEGVKTINTKIADVGPSLVTQSAAGADLLVGSKTDGLHVNFAGTSGNRELINVAAGTKDTSAVNLSQLKPVVAGLGGGAAVDTTTGAVTGRTYTIQNTPFNNAGDAFKAVNTNLSDLNTTVADIAGQTGSGLVIQDATTRDIKVAPLNDGTVVDMTGTTGARKITGVAAGSLDATSVDAINGSQLNVVGTGLATAIGGGAAFNLDGSITQPSFNVGGNTVHNVGDAITSLDGRISSSTTNLQNQITNITNNGGGAATPNAVAYDTAAHDQLTLGSTATDGTKTTTKISGLTDGDVAAGSTDAVTGNQLFELQDKVTNISSTGSTSIGINGADGVAGTAGPAGANGADAIAMGDNASASGTGAIVIGGGATAAGDGTIAIGGNAGASGKDSIAIGNGATAPANNAVALGAGSVADRDNSVSVGSADQQRQIANVAAGTQGTDAVNLNQMNSAVGGIARKAYSGIAAATALTMIPDVDANKTLSIGIGGGTFQGYAATAIGGTARITQNIKVRVGAGWSAAGTTVGAGASYQW